MHLIRLEKDKSDEIEIIQNSVRSRLSEFISGKKMKSDLRDKVTGKILIKARKTITAEDIEKSQIENWSGADINAPMDLIEKMEAIVKRYKGRRTRIEDQFNDRIEKMNLGDETRDLGIQLYLLNTTNRNEHNE